MAQRAQCWADCQGTRSVTHDLAHSCMALTSAYFDLVYLSLRNLPREVPGAETEIVEALLC